MIRPSTVVTHSPDRGYERGEDWRAAASCAHDPNPRAWDGPPHATRDDIEHAKHVCKTECPVLYACDAEARRLRPDGGVWAGRLIPEKHTHGKKGTT